MLLDCFLYSVLLRWSFLIVTSIEGRWGFEILLVVAGLCVCQGCNRTKQHDQLTRATTSQRTEDQRTRRPGTRQPGTRRPKDQGTKRTRRSPGRSRMRFAGSLTHAFWVRIHMRFASYVAFGYLEVCIEVRSHMHAFSHTSYHQRKLGSSYGQIEL